jgi:uncharacterized protein (DUF934 family)
MQIIKNQEIVENTWIYIPDDAKLPTEISDITVSLSRWNEEYNDLEKYQGRVGIRINPDDSIESLKPLMKKTALIEVNFPAFTDGRSFSLAQLLRTRLKFQGEIRAVGQFMPDQIFYLSRVGVNSFALEKQGSITDALAMFNDFSDSYQASVN